MQISRQVITDLTKSELKATIEKMKKERGLNAFDIENILYQILCEVKTEKEIMYADNIIDFADKLEKSKAPQILEENDNGQR